jgi:hypothetical protein
MQSHDVRDWPFALVFGNDNRLTFYRKNSALVGPRARALAKELRKIADRLDPPVDDSLLTGSPEHVES